MTLTAVSLFAGVGGFDLALERSGVDVVATVEIDPAARSVLARRFPGSRHLIDIQEVTGEELRDAGFVPDRGLLVGGFPCQDLSIAGRRAGLAGRRSGLFWEIVRLVDELRPRWLLLENVPGLLSSNSGRDFGAVLGSLVERGYGVAYRILDAQYFGLAQRRRRVFIVGCRGDDGGAPFQVLALAQGVCGDSAPGTTAGPDVAHALRASTAGRGVDDAYRTSLVASTLSSGSNGKAGRRQEDDTNVVHSLTTEYDANEDGTGRGLPLVPTLLTMREGKPGGGKGPLISEDKSLTLSQGNGQTLIHPYVKVVRSGARDADGNLPPEVSKSQAVAPTLSQFDQGEVRATTLVAFAHTQGLDIQPDETASPLTHNGHAMSDGAMVRRLTPLECERLQGFPDGWTDGQADSARYKQMGNAVAVPVAEWIARRLVVVDEGETGE